ncbi:MAG: cupin domain-containing protein [Acidimicrobiales bacterium]
MTTRPHFSLDGAGEPTAEGRFVDVDAVEPVAFVDGLNFRPVLGEQTMVNFVSFDPHTEAPRHAHVEEQIVLVLDGEFEFDLDGDVRMMRKGDVAVVPPWVPHGARTDAVPCLEVDVFNPPRETLLEHARQQRQEKGAALADPSDASR